MEMPRKKRIDKAEMKQNLVDCINRYLNAPDSEDVAEMTMRMNDLKMAKTEILALLKLESEDREKQIIKAAAMNEMGRKPIKLKLKMGE